MGEVRVDLELENYDDRAVANRGLMPHASVRSALVNALVDSGARMLVLPEELVDALGLNYQGSVQVTYADERKEQRPVAGVVTVRVCNRRADVSAIVGPRGSEPLFGQVPLEVMDLVIDCANERLIPNPASPDIPGMKIK